MLEDELILRMAVMHQMGDRVPTKNLTKKQIHVVFVVFSEIVKLHNVCRKQSGRHRSPFTTVFQVKYSVLFIWSTRPISENTCFTFYSNHLLPNNLVGYLRAWWTWYFKRKPSRTRLSLSTEYWLLKQIWPPHTGLFIWCHVTYTQPSCGKRRERGEERERESHTNSHTNLVLSELAEVRQ